MNRKDIISLLATFLCAVLILSGGYLGIVKAGNLLLSNEEKPQKAEFESSGSNIFYGKIEENISLFPWNYYDKNEVVPLQEEYLNKVEMWVLEETLRGMEAYSCQTDRDTINEVYDKKQSGIMENIKVCKGEGGYFFFYRDTIDVEGVRYQVKAAFDEWNLLSFSCMKAKEKNVRETPEWETGRKALTEMLDEYKEEIGGQIYDMKYPYASYYGIEELGYAYVEAYALNMEKMHQMIQKDFKEKIFDAEVENFRTEEEKAAEETMLNWSGYPKTYSYQVIELKDMILLLIQGDYTMGLFYDPVNQEFCGYNYFM